MVGFVVYDLVFMSLFILFVIIFLYKNRHNLGRQWIIFLYRTQFGVKFTDKFSKKFRAILKPLRYVVLISGYSLMIYVTWLIIKTADLYITTPISEVFRAPPIAPLIPYFPKLFGLESFFPPLFFTYFVIAIAIVAIVHEFSHGIFMRLENIKIKSTGFVFLGPILGAFVEQDDKQMNQASRFSQLSVLAGGTFANVLMFILFGAIMLLFFSATFVPAGISFNSYAVTGVNASDLSIVGDSGFNDNLVEVIAGENTYFADRAGLERAQGSGELIVYVDSPAVRNNLRGAITEINGEKITSRNDLSNVLEELNPGDEVMIKTAVLEAGQGTVAENLDYEFELGENEGSAFLGIGFFPVAPEGAFGFLYENTLAKVKEPLVFYESKIGDFGWFVYYLLWWIVVINVLVALFNMLPLGMLDGGRFFQLTIEKITGSKKAGEKSFKVVTWIIVLIFVALMVKWASTFF